MLRIVPSKTVWNSRTTSGNFAHAPVVLKFQPMSASRMALVAVLQMALPACEEAPTRQVALVVVLGVLQMALLAHRAAQTPQVVLPPRWAAA